MSILIPDLKVYKYVEAGFIYAAHNKTCDNKYSYSVVRQTENKDPFEEARRWVKNLLRLNLISYNTRYNENERDNLPTTATRTETKAHQLLKYLQCIDYNIEVETIQKLGSYDEDRARVNEQDLKDIKLLRDFIQDIQTAIIAQTEEYKTAKWSD